MSVTPSTSQPYPGSVPATAANSAASTQYLVPLKSVGTAYLWWFFLGGIGAHQYYLGKVGRAVSYTLTLGWLGIGVLIDLFTLGKQVRAVNAQIQVGTRQG